MVLLEIVDIFQETYEIILTWKKIFSQIALSLILPLTFIFLAHMEISNLLFGNFFYHVSFLHKNNQDQDARKYNELSELITPKLTLFWLFNISYIVFLFVFSLLSTSAVVYTVACIHTGREISFKQIISIVPKVWKRLVVTFFCVFASFFAYNLLAVFAFILLLFILLLQYGPFGDVNGSIFVVFFIIYFIGLLYLSVVVQLSSVVTVLEESYGFKAMAKSKALLKGKMLVATLMLLLINISLVIIQQAFVKLVVHGVWFGIVGRGILGIVCLFLLLNFFLWQLVLETVLYFVCKEHHQENIDKSALSNHLQVYLLNGYIPLTPTKNVELEKLEEV
uniref:Transmembrane protein n=1 Tax=Cucumis melo TaxID=3656 RepID=A0A9I9DYB7_CUCME